jgi:hypothetical protein
MRQLTVVGGEVAGMAVAAELGARVPVERPNARLIMYAQPLVRSPRSDT